MKTETLEICMEKFCNRLDNQDNDEYYETRQERAWDVLTDFLGYVKSVEKIEEAILLLEKEGYTISR